MPDQQNSTQEEEPWLRLGELHSDLWDAILDVGLAAYKVDVSRANPLEPPELTWITVNAHREAETRMKDLIKQEIDYIKEHREHFADSAYRGPSGSNDPF